MHYKSYIIIPVSYEINDICQVFGIELSIVLSSLHELLDFTGYACIFVAYCVSTFMHVFLLYLILTGMHVFLYCTN